MAWVLIHSWATYRKYLAFLIQLSGNYVDLSEFADIKLYSYIILVDFFFCVRACVLAVFVLSPNLGVWG